MRHRVFLACALLAFLAAPAHATRLARARTANGVDWVSAGIGGIPGDTADIVLAGVTGPVTKAYLYWDGMSIDPGDNIYDNDTIAIDGNVIVGTSLGDTSSNCWGQGASRAYVADVTAYVAGDGTYSLSGLKAEADNQANGASLVVLFDDGNPANDRDLLFFEGNDSTHLDHFAGLEDKAWHAVFDGVNFQRGTVNVQIHAADGQSTNDSALTFLANNKTLIIPDTPALWDGLSVPLAGTSRADGQALWDIHTFDITSLFRSHGTFTVFLDTATQPADCIALVLAVFDTAAAPVAVCGDGVKMGAEECDDGNLVDGDCCDATCHIEPAGTVCANPGDPCLESRCDGAGTCDDEGRSCRMPVSPRAGLLVLRHGKQDRLSWKWWTGVSRLADFGAPDEDTDYDLCLYDKGTGSRRLLGRTTITASEDCGGTPCWQRTATGYEYRNPAGELQQLTLEGGRPGRAKITAHGAGGGLTLPTMPLSPMVMVRLHAANGQCWGANYTLPARNSWRTFWSRGDYTYP